MPAPAAIRDAILGPLNDAQREAVTATSGPVLVLAGAGSGKTRVIAHRIAYLLAVEGVSPRQVIAVTFTNRAAEEMRRRVADLVLPLGLRPPLIATFHSTCVRILREHAPRIGLPAGFVIYDEDDRLTLVKEAMRELQIDERELTPASAVHRLSHAKNQMVTVEEAERLARTPREERVASLYRIYETRLRAAGADRATALRGVWGFDGPHGPHGDTLRSLRARGLVATTVAVGACVDGDVQCVSPASALLWCAAEGFDAVVCAVGPGVVGTGSSFGLLVRTRAKRFAIW